MEDEKFEKFEQGCWLTVIGDIEKEYEILTQRQNASDAILRGHDNQGAENYTDYSSATFVKRGMAISLFGMPDDEAGVFIDLKGRPADYWYNGLGEVITDDFPRIPGQRFNNGEPGQYWDVADAEISSDLEAIHRRYLNKHVEEAIEDFPQLTWNEGMFRYKFENIIAIRVNPENIRSIKRAFDIERHFRLNLPFYRYDEKTGTCENVSRDFLLASGYLNYESPNSEELADEMDFWTGALPPAPQSPNREESSSENGDDDMVITINVRNSN